MKTSCILGFLTRSLLLGLVSGLLACSSILQAARIDRPLAQLPAEIGSDVPPESVHKKVFVNNNAQRMNIESIYGLPLPTLSYQWLFFLKERAQTGASTGYWQVDPINPY